MTEEPKINMSYKQLSLLIRSYGVLINTRLSYCSTSLEQQLLSDLRDAIAHEIDASARATQNAMSNAVNNYPMWRWDCKIRQIAHSLDEEYGYAGRHAD